jgi:transcriptional regulator with XRE-family HTH domain
MLEMLTLHRSAPQYRAGNDTARDRFATELRTWRAKRGLSQLDLAIRAGTTQRHLSFIERARSLPGRTMVVRLAESLDLQLRDRNQLLLAAGYAPVYPESDLNGPLLEPTRHALEVILEGHEPYPAVIARTGGEVIGANAAFGVLTDGVDPALLMPPINAYRLALHPRGLAPRITNLATWGRHVLHALEAALRRGPNPELERALRELESYVPAVPPDEAHLGFAVPLQLRTPSGEMTLISTITSFATATDVTLADLRLEAFLPANAETAQILQSRSTIASKRSRTDYRACRSMTRTVSPSLHGTN